MKRLKFYVCPTCGNILTATGEAELCCCGRRLAPLQAQPAEGVHRLRVEHVEDDFYLTFSHPMEKEHFLQFVAYVSYDRMMLVRLYPEQSGEVRMPAMHGGSFYFGCSKHGLWVQKEQ